VRHDSFSVYFTPFSMFGRIFVRIHIYVYISICIYTLVYTCIPFLNMWHGLFAFAIWLIGEEMLFIGIQMEDQVWSPAQLSPLKDTLRECLFSWYAFLCFNGLENFDILYICYNNIHGNDLLDSSVERELASRVLHWISSSSVVFVTA